MKAGDANTVTSAILEFLEETGIEKRKIVGFGSDGAAVMVGKRNGVAARLRDEVPV